MPEACFLCLDSTEYMRNGDQFPNRLMAEQEAANLLVNAKIETNAENTVGFLTMGGAACTVFETLTLDIDRVMAALTSIPIAGRVCHFSRGLLIASLALSHRTNPRSQKRIVAFVGSPIEETEEDLQVLAKTLRKDDVAVDVVAFGAESNIPLLESFIGKVNRQSNSLFLFVKRGDNLTDALMGSPILLGNRDEASPSAGPAEDIGFQVDPNVDPELAMALRESMEEEMRRQRAAAGDATSVSEAATATAMSVNDRQAPVSHNEEEIDIENMSEEEMLRRAVAMSLQEMTVASPQERGESATEDDLNFARKVEEALENEEPKKDDAKKSP